MLVSETTEINDSCEKIWNTLRSFDGVERYSSVVTNSIVEGNGQGAKRTCDVTMGKQMFQIQETLEILDDANQSLTISLDEGPIQMKGMKFTFVVKNLGEDKSDLTISTNVENPDSISIAKSIFGITGEGLKKFHES